MSSITIYNTSTGEIHSRISDSGSLNNYPLPSGHGKVEGSFSGKTHYVENGSAQLKSQMSTTQDKFQIMANDTEIATISGVPVGSVCYVNDESIAIDDGTLEVSADTPMVLNIKITNVKYIDKEYTVNAI